MNTWIRIVLISALALILLEHTAIAIGTTQENTTKGAHGWYDAYQRADRPSGDINRSSPIPGTLGSIIADSNGAKVSLTIVSGPSVCGVPIFPTDHIWNTRVDSLPVDPQSAAYVGTIGSTAYLHADFGSGMYEGNPIGIPYNIVNGSQERKTVTFDYADESDAGPYPIPVNPLIEGGSDHHMVIIDRDAKSLYELYAAEKQADGTWAAGSGAVFNLSGYTLRPSGWTSADAAGLAILPGLVRYDEVNAGEINHALRFTAPSTRRAYIWPARHYASSITDPAYPPMGQRFRLKSSFNTSVYPYQAQIVLEALKKYGMILSDNGAPWYITGVPDEQWNNDALHTLHQLKGSDFEAVDSSSLIISENSGQALINPVVTGTSHRIGIFRPSTHSFYLDYNGNGMWNGATVDRQYNFGISGDIPVSGDWNLDGRTEIGVFRNSTHMFYLDYNGNGVWNGAVTDRQYNLGISGDIPVSGDWNLDGRTEIGVFRPSTHMFYLEYNGNGVWNGASVDKQCIFGISGDIPVTGDWNLDGRTEIGVFRPSTHMFYLEYNGNCAWNGASVDRQYNFGLSEDLPVTGDWNADVRTEIGVFRPSTHLFYLDYNGNGVWNGAAVDRSYSFGINGDKPVTGKWSVPSQQLPTNIQMIANVYGLASNPSAGIDQIQYTIGLVPGSPSLNLEMMNVIFSTPTFGPKVLVWTAGTASTTDTNFIALKNGSGTSQSIMAEGDQMQIIFNMTVVPKNTKMNITSLPANGNALPFSKTTPATISTFNVLY